MSSTKKLLYVFTAITMCLILGALSVLLIYFNGFGMPSVGTDTTDESGNISSDIGDLPPVSDPITSAPDTALPPDTTEEVTDPPVTSPPYTEPSTISFVGCGDNIVYRPIIWEGQEKNPDGEADYTFLYEDIKDIIAGADIAYINQETLLGGSSYEYTGYPKFNGPFGIGKALGDIGFDILSLATNHMLDNGTYEGLESGGERLLSSLDFYATQPYITVGGYRNEEDEKTLRVIEKEGIKVGFLNYTEHLNMMYLTESSEIVIPLLKADDGTIEKIKSDVERAKAGCDFLIVFVHWGEDGSRDISDTQRLFSELFCEWGVDALIGHHPHVINKITELEKNGNRMLCVYSLGNFLSMMDYPLSALGGIVSFDITKDEKGVSYSNVLFTPTVSHYNRYYRENKIYLLSDYTDELCRENGISAIYQNSFTVSYLYQYLNSVIDESYLK